ncbi:CPBP family intramembrane glutamic endopeptidase [Gluconacetobacter asukensis]|uniref:CPBP family intramembrane metalloprotease n=1 Tax=Gluconacetobacter asukensis TaxID=1017181 RepID=A0A7W4NYU4_9PROT|nr:CPBP family intramembrane glutamic endopeptidase [Gluconacetobacter asukensis]MBB2171207.1 CPBP family intramembrane metalloprotease [Gluconacetobacter asukensis]
MSFSPRNALSTVTPVAGYFILSFLVLRYIHLPGFARLADMPGSDPAAHAIAKLGNMCLSELFLLFLICCVTAAFAAIEHRDAAFCGFPLNRTAFVRIAQGCGLSLVGALILAAFEYLFGGLRFTGLIWSGPVTISIILLSALTLAAVGFTEELWFRGYPQRRLEDGIGWWPAAFITSLVFALCHLANQGENIVEIILLFLSGLVLCGLRRVTFSLWLGVGAHAVADFSDIILGSPDPHADDSPFQIVHLLVDGPAWLNGGDNGVMFSVPGISTQYLMMLVAILLFRPSQPKGS